MSPSKKLVCFGQALLASKVRQRAGGDLVLLKNLKHTPTYSLAFFSPRLRKETPPVSGACVSSKQKAYLHYNYCKKIQYYFSNNALGILKKINL